MKTVLSQYLDKMHEVAVCRLSRSLSEVEEDRFADELEYLWNRLTPAEEEEARRQFESGKLMNAQDLAFILDVDSPTIRQSSAKK